MSVTRSLTYIIPVLLCGLLACGKKEQPIDPYVSANAGGYKFYSSGKMVTVSRSAGTTSSLYIEAVMPGSGATVGIWIKNYSGALDTIALDSTRAYATWLPPTPSVQTSSAYGTLIITESTPAFKGTFNFVCKDTTHVSGDFRVQPQ